MSRDLRIAGVLALVAAFAAPGLASGAGTRVLGWGSVDRDATRTHLGNGKQGNFTAPVEIDELDGATEVMVEGVDETFALFGSGLPTSWGEGQNAPWRGGAEAALPVAASESLRGARQIESSYDMALALMPDGSVMAWDSDSAPAAVPGLSGVVDVDAVRGAGLAVLADGTVKSWGSDFHGQLGNGAAAATSAPTTIPGLTGVTRLVGSQFFAHVIALRSDGTLRVWGMDSFGALGDPGVAPESCGGGACRTAPYDPGLQDVQGIGIGEFNGYAVMEDGTVRAWGTDANGELGNGPGAPATCTHFGESAPCSETPVTVAALQGVDGVSGGNYQAMAHLADGRVAVWGQKLGAPGVDIESPQVVEGVDDVIAFAVGGEESSRAYVVVPDDGGSTPPPPPPPGPPPPSPPPPPPPADGGSPPGDPARPGPATPSPEERLAARRPDAIAGAFGLPSKRRCQSRRRFAIRLREPAGVDIAKAVLTVARRRTTARLVGGRWRATVDLRGLPKGRFVVRIDVTTKAGRKVTGSRAYRTCATKRRRGRVREI